MPREMFAIFAKVVRNCKGFGMPFCCHSDNKSMEVVRFTSICLIKELFVLLSALPAVNKLIFKSNHYNYEDKYLNTLITINYINANKLRINTFFLKGETKL